MFRRLAGFVILASLCLPLQAAKVRDAFDLAWNPRPPTDPATLVPIKCIHNEDGHCKDERITHYIMRVCIGTKCVEHRLNGGPTTVQWKQVRADHAPGDATFKLKACRFLTVKRPTEDVWDETETIECSGWSNTVIGDRTPPAAVPWLEYQR
jgi:hypothetical protein